jgi:hypothetical protein
MVPNVVNPAAEGAQATQPTTTFKAVVVEGPSPPPTPYHTAPEESASSSSSSPAASEDRMMDLSPELLERHNRSNNINNNSMSKENERTSDLSTTSSSTRAKRVSTIREGDLNSIKDTFFNRQNNFTMLRLLQVPVLPVSILVMENIGTLFINVPVPVPVVTFAGQSTRTGTCTVNKTIPVQLIKLWTVLKSIKDCKK